MLIRLATLCIRIFYPALIAAFGYAMIQLLLPAAADALDATEEARQSLPVIQCILWILVILGIVQSALGPSPAPRCPCSR